MFLTGKDKAEMLDINCFKTCIRSQQVSKFISMLLPMTTEQQVFVAKTSLVCKTKMKFPCVKMTNVFFLSDVSNLYMLESS